ncbi:MAG: KH domain-containing protein, partial [Kiritimatiellia bacterium]|nr:KH domain-containing protein [Kiritimatiellia bacterium]
EWRVEAEILVERPSHKGMVIGEKGRLLKSVKHRAEQDLAEMYGLPVRLDLWVKVERDWRKNFWIMRKLGYA